MAQSLALDAHNFQLHGYDIFEVQCLRREEKRKLRLSIFNACFYIKFSSVSTINVYTLILVTHVT